MMKLMMDLQEGSLGGSKILLGTNKWVGPRRRAKTQAQVHQAQILQKTVKRKRKMMEVRKIKRTLMILVGEIKKIRKIRKILVKMIHQILVNQINQNQKPKRVRNLNLLRPHLPALLDLPVTKRKIKSQLKEKKLPVAQKRVGLQIRKKAKAQGVIHLLQVPLPPVVMA